MGLLAVLVLDKGLAGSMPNSYVVEEKAGQPGTLVLLGLVFLLVFGAGS